MIKQLMSEDAKAGVWYQSAEYGRVLCCGTTSTEDWTNAFAVRTDEGRTVMKYLSREVITTCPQYWDLEHEALRRRRASVNGLRSILGSASITLDMIPEYEAIMRPIVEAQYKKWVDSLSDEELGEYVDAIDRVSP